MHSIENVCRVDQYVQHLDMRVDRLGVVFLLTLGQRMGSDAEMENSQVSRFTECQKSTFLFYPILIVSSVITNSAKSADAAYPSRR